MIPIGINMLKRLKKYRKCSIKRPGRLFEILTFRVGAYSRGAVNREGRL